MNLKEFIAVSEAGNTFVLIAKDLGHALYQCQELFPLEIFKIYPLMEW